ncbi:MAG: hypothetical protein EBS56_05830 [Planctomycetia bacterium]|nr:hypothetical protein [Planctomycetia bacterium]
MWLPWLFAPLFMAAPIGGCGLAQRWRPPVAAGVEGSATPPRAVGRDGWRGRDDRPAPKIGDPPVVAWARAAH